MSRPGIESGTSRSLVIYDLKSHKMVEIPGYRWVSDKVTLMTGQGLYHMHKIGTFTKRGLYLM